MSGSTRRALAFLAHTVLRPCAVLGAPCSLDLADGRRLAARCYMPSGEPWATVVFVHGMSLRGCDDPRLAAGAHALARTGVRVLTPHYPSIAAMRFDPTAVRTIRASLLATHTAWPGRLGLVSVSFSAGLALRAASHPRLAHTLHSALAIGGYADSDRVLEWLMTDPAADPYGRLVLVHELVRQTGSASPQVCEALRTAIADDGLRRDPPSLPVVLARSTAADRARFDQLCRDPEAARIALKAMRSRHPDTIAALSVLPLSPHLQTPVTLLHGRHDRVLPASESVHMASVLRAAGRPVRLHLTELLDHGDVGGGVRALAEVPSLAAAIGHFFHRLARP